MPFIHLLAKRPVIVVKVYGSRACDLRKRGKEN
jgi:hypothetical protein